MPPIEPLRIRCVGAVVHDGSGRLLLVRRRNPPAAGTWSLPGGRVEQGEDDAAAVVREVAEETGLTVRVGRVVGLVERDAPSGGVYAITDLACEVVGGLSGRGTMPRTPAGSAPPTSWSPRRPPGWSRP